MTKSSNILLIDGSHLAYRAYYKFMNLKTLDGVKTSIIYGIPFILESIIRKHNPTKVIMVHDGGRSKFRLSLLPDYKKRDKKLGFDAVDFYKQKDIATDVLIGLGVSVVGKIGFEADDLICMLTRRFTNKGESITIVSGDKDFNQLINEKVTVWNSNKNERYNLINLKYKVGYEPNQCVDYLCLLGDSSDNIPGYKGMGEKKTLEFLSAYGSIASYFETKSKYKSIDNDKLLGVYKINRKLIDLNYFYRKFLMKESIPWVNQAPSIDIKAVKTIAKKYEIGTFMKPDFLKTFSSYGD